jgi:energy-converting hydrogenase Eha subunit A
MLTGLVMPARFFAALITSMIEPVVMGLPGITLGKSQAVGR